MNGVLKSGYNVSVVAAAAGLPFAGVPCNAPGAVPSSIFYATATPVAFQASGTRSFATDARGTIWQNNTAAPPADPPAAPNVPVQ